MFHRILVAIDQSDLVEHMVEIGIAQAKATQGSLLLLHVLNIQEKEFPQIEGRTSENYNHEAFDAEVQSYEQHWKIYQQKALNSLKVYSERTIAAGVEAEYSQQISDLVGNPGETICAVAEEWKADLIIIGHQGLSGVRELIQGSVSNHVFHRSPCSVLSVQVPVTAKTKVTSAQT